MTLNNDKILGALAGIKHPETGKDLVSMQMIRDITVEENKVSVTLQFSKQKDPFASSVSKAVEQAVQALAPDNLQVEVLIAGPPVTKKENQSNAVLPGVKNIIAVASGKGGVGKSTIAANLAVAVAQTGASVGLIDADIFGPSIPKMFNAEKLRPHVNTRDGKEMIVPIEQYGVKLLSVGFFVDPEDALVWRGPMATNALKQLIQQGDWEDLDYLFVDLPPGTSDVHLTLVQEVPVTGAVIVSTPQAVALADAIKGIKMFQGEKVNVPVLGLIENMAWFTPAELPENKYYLFGKEGVKNLAAEMKIPFLGQIPLVQSIRENGDSGSPSALDDSTLSGQAFRELAGNLLKEVDNRNKTMDPTKKVEITKH
ncbi:MAG TPA: Mrp/NBP35 family ATP-binding protein [Bacteroidales bacterium]|nr:Mrp/NBP35 family ATP-binding protein [Bacteroidales bacterium]